MCPFTRQPLPPQKHSMLHCSPGDSHIPLPRRQDRTGCCTPRDVTDTSPPGDVPAAAVGGGTRRSCSSTRPAAKHIKSRGAFPKRPPSVDKTRTKCDSMPNSRRSRRRNRTRRVLNRAQLSLVLGWKERGVKWRPRPTSR